MRLIDADALVERGNAEFGGVHDAVLLKHFVDSQPTINPEDLPIVQQLRKWVQDLDHQLSEWKFWYGPMREREAKELRENQAAVNVMRKHCEKTIAELREELARVTAERDAAVECITTKCRYIEDTERGPYCVIDDEPCCRCEGVWRGPQKEE